MNIDQPLPRDPGAAAAILSALEEKDKDETLCRYPTCHNPRQAAPLTGRPSAYCENPDHSAVSNHRARQQLRSAAAGATSSSTASRQESPVMAPVESLRTTVMNGMLQLQTNLERYLSALHNIADPDLSAAQIQASLDQTNTRVAEAQQAISAERSLRLAAETARMAAEAEAQEEREAAESAIQRMEEAEARVERQRAENERRSAEIQTEYTATIERQRVENERRSAEIQAEHAATIEHMRIEMQHQIEEIKQHANKTIVRAQTATTMAVEEAKQADGRAHEALAQAATAERLVSEAHIALDRERKEIDRLRKEHAEAIADARARAETDRSEARTALNREREEINRLRSELATTRKQAEQATMRADTLASTNDDLRGQLVQLQMKSREQPKQK